MFSLDGLNAAQRTAAETVEGPVLILAGAGSGKTRTITFRIAHMIKNLCMPARQILAVSFTNKAAAEMKERVIDLLGKEKGSELTVTTFHSLGVRILKQEIDRLGYEKNFSIYDTSDQISIIREALRHFKDSKKFDQKTIQSKISFLKNQGIYENDFANSEHFDPESGYDHATEYAYRYYQEKLKFYNAIDFDDILFLTVRLFNENPDLSEKYSRIYKYIMIDEYQDTNNLQFNLITSLTKTHDNLCVVGDDDQSIYAFRGADISNILNFEKNFPGAKVVKLEENYRSTAPILNLANEVIKLNKHRRDKTLRSQKQSSVVPMLWATGDSDHEAMIILDEIIAHQSQGKNLDELAILYRSNNQAGVIEDQLRLSNIPYRLLGGQKFYDKKEIKDLIAYMLLMLNPNDQLALRRIINVPNRGIGTATLNKFLNKSKETGLSLFKTIVKYPALDPKRASKVKNFADLIMRYQANFRSRPLAETVEKFVNEVGIYEYIEKQHSDNPKQVEHRKKDVLQFIDSAIRFSRYYQNPSLRDFVEKLLLKDSQDEKESEDDEQSTNQVTLMTLHSSKGLEFDTVFLAGMEEEILPHKRTIIEGEDINEERRLCYVGITRARERLVMTYCKERVIYGKKIPRHKSRFLNDLKNKDLFIEQDRTTFGHLTEDEAEKYKQNFFSSLIDSLD